MFQSNESTFHKEPINTALDGWQTFYYSFFLFIVFFFFFKPLLFAPLLSHGFYFAIPEMQNACILLELLLPSVITLLLLNGPRTAWSVFASWLIIPGNLIFLCVVLVVIFSSNSRFDRLSINQFNTSNTVRKQLGDVIVGMSSVPVLDMQNYKGEQVLFTRLWIERPVFFGFVREFKILVAEEGVEGKFFVCESEKKIVHIKRNFYGQSGENWIFLDRIDWSSP